MSSRAKRTRTFIGPCDVQLPTDITVARPADTPTTGWSNEIRTGYFYSGDCELCFTIGAESGNTPQMMALDSGNTNASWETLDYAIYIYKANTTTFLRVYESGAFRAVIANSWSVGDEACIRKTGTLVEYMVNGTVEYTSTVPSNSPLQVGSTFYYTPGFWGTGSISFTNINFCQV